MIKPKIIDYKLEFRNLARRNATNYIVIHHTGDAEDDDLSAKEIHEIHKRNGWAGIGYHFVVRKDGSIEYGRPMDCVGAHAEDCNWDSLGIHLSGNFELVEPTDEQIESVSKLLAWLCEHYGLDITEDTIVGHRDLPAPAGETACPGENLYNRLDDIRGKAVWYQEHYDNDGNYHD